MIDSIALKTVRMLSLFVDPKQIASISKYLFIKKLLGLHNISLIVDVGGNVGQFARAMRLIGYKGAIASFEPVGAQFAKLSSIARNDPKWNVYNMALGDRSETKTINVMKSSVFSSFHEPTTHRTALFAEQNDIQGTEVVHVRTLAEMVRELGVEDELHRTFLKCDTQGFDRHVLVGAGDLLPKICMLQMELSIMPIYDNAPSMTEMLGFIEPYGFAPVAMFPIVRLQDWTAAEFDYIGVNRGVSSASDLGSFQK